MTKKVDRTKIKFQRLGKRQHRRRIGMFSSAKTRRGHHAVSVCICYAHADEWLRTELGKHLSVLQRQGLISTWHDRMIGAGDDWEGVIDEHLERARVILLLVSADFISSPYCWDVEMQRALERHMSGAALVIPVVLRPVVLHGMLFAKLHALPRDARPATIWPDLDSAFVDVTEGVREAVEGLR